MKNVIEFTLNVICVIIWFFGIYFANGFFSTLFAVIFPPWGWFLVAWQIVATYMPGLLG